MSVTSRCRSVGLSNFFLSVNFWSVSCLSVSCLSVSGCVTDFKRKMANNFFI